MLLERFQFADPSSNRTLPKGAWSGLGVMLAIHDHEIVLDAPDGVTKSIRVQIEMEPKDGVVWFGGHFLAGSWLHRGSRDRRPIDLPFVRHRAYLQFLPGTTGCKIKTLGWRAKTAPLAIVTTAAAPSDKAARRPCHIANEERDKVGARELSGGCDGHTPRVHRRSATASARSG